MPDQRPHSVLTTAGIPLVRVEIDTSRWSADRWEEARKIDPETMAFAVPVRTLPLPDGQVRVVLAVEPDEYAVGYEVTDGHATSYIKMLLDLEAGLILDNDEEVEEIDEGPSDRPDDDGIPF